MYKSCSSDTYATRIEIGIEIKDIIFFNNNNVSDAIDKYKYSVFAQNLTEVQLICTLYCFNLLLVNVFVMVKGVVPLYPHCRGVVIELVAIKEDKKYNIYGFIS